MYPWLCSWREGGMASISSPQHSLHSQPLRAHVARLAVGSFCTYQPCWGLPCSRLLHALSSLFCREMRTAHIHCRGWEGSHEKWQPAAVPPKPPLPAGGGVALFLAATRSTPQFPAMQNLLLLSFRGIKKKKVYSHPRTSHWRNKDVLLQPGRSRWLLPWDTAAFPQHSRVPQHSHCSGARQNGELPTALQSATSLNQA